MLLDTVFSPFVQKQPICVMTRGVLERLLDVQRTDMLFDCTAEQQHTRELLFSSVKDTSCSEGNILEKIVRPSPLYHMCIQGVLVWLSYVPYFKEY
jgi:hypothetical protein